MVKDPYQTLGISPTATLDEARAAWLQRVRVLHPDRFDPVEQKTEWDMSTQMLQDVNAAWEAIRTGRASYSNRGTAPRPSPRQEYAPPPQSPTPVPPEPSVHQDELAGFKTRIAARTIDTALVVVPAFIFSIPVFMLFGFGKPEELLTSSLRISPLWIFSVLGQTIAYDAAFLLWDVVWIGTIGATPGKLIFGLRVVRENGERMQMVIAWRRVWRLFYSLAFLLFFPLVTFGVAISKEKEFKKTGTTPWDQRVGTVVTGKKIGVVRKFLGTVLSILSVIYWLYMFSLSHPRQFYGPSQPPVGATPMSSSVTVSPRVSTESTSQPPTPEPVTPAVPAIVAPALAPAPATSAAVAPVATDNAEAASLRISAEGGNVEAARKLGSLYLFGQGVPKDFTEALKWFQMAADHGDVKAQFNIGTMYFRGQGVTQDYSQAISWFQKAANQGDSDSQCNIAWMYENGLGVTQDYSKALSLYQKAADQGDPKAQYNIGLMYQNSWGVAQDFGQAVLWYQKASDQGDASAQNQLGYMWEHGLGLPQDFSQAFKSYQLSAEQGDADAQVNIATLYFNGQGVTQDYSQALSWFHKAADQGDAKAQNGIAYMYRNGKGVTQDYSKALSWVRKSADQGDASAQYRIGFMYEDGEGVAKDTTIAVQWYKKAAAQRQSDAQAALKRLDTASPPAQVTPPAIAPVATDNIEAAAYRVKATAGDVGAAEDLGTLYLTGQGVPKDYAEAMKWLQIAADRGYPMSQYNIGLMYANGLGVKQNISQALSWYIKAGDKGNTSAQCSIAKMYEYGWGVTQDYSQALSWYIKAGDQGDSTAEYNIGFMYERGWGVVKDTATAVESYQKAAAQNNPDAQAALKRLGQ